MREQQGKGKEKQYLLLGAPTRRIIPYVLDGMSATL